MSEEDVKADVTEEIGAIPVAVDQPVFRHDGGRIGKEIDPKSITPYNFRNPGSMRLGDLRQFEQVTRKFVEHLTARLSTFLRMECTVKMVTFSTAAYSEFTASLDEVTNIAIFQVDPLDGIGIMDMSLPLSLCVADRMLGGKGKVADSDRGLTEIETALVEDAAHLILTELTRHWPERATAYVPSIIGHDSSARFLNTAEDDALHIIIQTEMAIGECKGMMQLGIPFSMIEPIVKLMDSSRPKPGDVRSRSVEWRSQFSGIHVPLVAEWVVKEMAVREVIKLQPGDVLEMSRDLIGQTQVRLSNATEFIGTAGVEDGRVAVQLTQRKTPE
jgi:flagellar motor switch protein FliM